MSAYHRHPLGSVFAEIPRATLAILIGCLALWFVEVGTLGAWDEGFWSHLRLSAPRLLRGEVWQLVTYQFLHHPRSLLHILFNMLLLVAFGRRLEQRWGTWGFVRFFLICGVGGGILYVLAALLLRDPTGVVGASGSLMGVLLASALIWPRDRMSIMFVLTVELRHAVLIIALIDLMLAWTGAMGGSATGAVAHLGGLLTGWAYLAHAHRLARWLPRQRPRPLAALARWWRRRRMQVVDRDFDQWLKQQDDETRH